MLKYALCILRRRRTTTTTTPTTTTIPNMLFLIPSLALSILSLLSSIFIILRIILPILPPLPISSRVPPKEFGLPNFRSLSLSDKSHLWLATSDLIALAFFIWQAISESLNPTIDFNIPQDSASAARIWIAVTFRQSLLFIIIALVLLHIRLGLSVSFGKFHWRILAPTSLIWLIAISSTCILSQVGLATLYPGILAFTATTAVFTTAAFACLFGTLVVIRRNLTAPNDSNDSWPPVLLEKRRRPSFATEEIDALRDGSSWITSNASSHRRSLSAFSFSTYHSIASSTHVSSRVNINNPVTGSYPSIPPKSSFWFSPATPANGQLVSSPIPPVPPLPSPYRTVAAPIDPESADPFRRDFPLQPFGSQGSWLTEPSSSQETLAAWSFPTTRPSTPGSIRAISIANSLPQTAVDRMASPALSSAQVLGGYGYSPTPITLSNAEKAVSAFSAVPNQDFDVSIRNLFMWLLTIWLPVVFSFPYFVLVSSNQQSVPAAASIFLTLSVTLSSPLLAFNILLRSPLPIPSDLFDVHPEKSILPSPTRPSTQVSRYKRSGSMTVVEGRRSGDVWISKGDAVDGKSKFGRALGLLAPKPKLSVLPLESEQIEDGEITPPLPMQTGEQSNDTFSPQSETSAELGRRYRDSRASSRFSGADDSVALTTRIMTAQRHYSALATTVLISPSKENPTTGFTTSTPARQYSHLRTRSTSSISRSNKSTVSGPRSPITPPPSIPLPPTPPRPDGQQDYSFSAVDDINEIDRLSAGLLPLLVPGLRVGSDIRIKDSPLPSATPKLPPTDISSSFSSPELHSTPARNFNRSKKKSKHFSLPSLGLGKDGIHSLNVWKEDITSALTQKATYVTEDGRRNTVWSGSYTPNSLNHLRTVHEEEESRKYDSDEKDRVPESNVPSSTTSDNPSNVNVARTSLTTLIAALEPIPSSAASTSTLFSDIGGPVAESTPRERRQNLARAVTHDNPAPSTRSSIVYIRSDENANSSNSSTTPQTFKRLQLKPKANKLVKPTSNDIHSESQSPALRQLSLLQDKDMNRNDTRSSGVRPLVLARKQRQNENDVPTSYKLARSATSKARALLRKGEVLPQVVVRPPSTSDSSVFGYSARTR